MTAAQLDQSVLSRLQRIAPLATDHHANILRRAAITLSRWAEQECGDGDDYKSWAIERDETTGKPYRCVYPHNGKSYREPIPDREAGALRRVKEVCDELCIHFYHQTDPRGASLYVAAEPLTDTNYTRGIAIY